MLLDFDKHFKTFYNALKVKLKSHRGNWNQNDPNADDYIKGKTHWIDNDGNIHPLDESYIPNTIARTSDVAASVSSRAEAEHSHGISDVNGLQTALDGKASSWNDLTEKPFETIIEYVEVLNQPQIGGNKPYTNQYARDRLNLFTLEDGKTYKVCIGKKDFEDTKEFEVTARTETLGNYDYVVIGSKLLMSNVLDDTDLTVPFAINTKLSDGRSAIIWHASLVDDYYISCSIHEVVKKIKPLDYKYMPEGYPKAETKMVEVLPEQSVTGEEGSSDSYFYSWNSLPFIEIKEGIEYAVTINGDVYNAVGEVVPLPSDLTPEAAAEMGIIKTTGIHIYNGNNEVAISTLSIGNGGYNEVYWSKTWGETISLKLIAKTKKVKPIDKVFLRGEVETVEVYRNDSLSLSSEYTDDGRLTATHEDWDIGKKLLKKDHTYKVVWNGKEYTFIASVKQPGYNSLSLGDFYYRKDSFEISINEDDMPNKPCLWITWDVNVHGKAISVVIYDMESEVESGEVCNVIIRDNTASGGAITCNKTVEQIKQAYLSGKAISAILSLDNDYNIKHLIMETSDPINLGFVTFSTPLEYGYKNLSKLIYGIESDGSITEQYWTQDISIPE